MRPVSKGITWDRLKSICEQFKENWVDGITLSGGEPTLCPSLDEIIQFFKSFGFKIKLDTNGSVPSVIEDLMPQLDCISMDIKCSLQRYPELTGFEKADLISRSIELVMNNFSNYEFRTTIIPGFHTDDEMKSVMELIYNANTFVLQPFLPRPDLPNIKFRSIERTPSERLQALANMARLYVEKVVVAGV
jgi:pyruvate formate lyase activating enzyme